MVILYAGPDGQIREKYISGLKGQEIYLAGEQDLDNTLQELFDKGEDLSVKESNGEPFLVVDFDPGQKEEVEKLLDSLAAAGIERPLMACRTEENRKWPLRVLKDEISREAAYFSKLEQLMELVKSFTKEEMMTSPVIQRSVMTGYMLLKQPEIPEKHLDLALKALGELREQLDQEKS